MLQFETKAEYCGCGACEQICPKNCITLKNDTEGFSYCTVDVTKCINCHLCEKVCPIINAGAINNNNAAEVQTFVALCNDDNLREQSSSGGLFSIFAEQALSLG